MVETAPVTLLDGVPDGEYVGMQIGIGLAAVGCIPQIGIALAVGYRRAANHVFFVARNVESPVSALDYSLEKLLLRNEALRFQQMVLAQQFVERLKLLGCFYLFADDAAFFTFFYHSLHAFRYALLGSTTVQRVVYAHPVDREELLLAELAVAKHLLALIAHFDVEHAVAEPLPQRVEHLSEDLATLFNVRVIDTFAKQSAVHEEVGWNPRCAVANDGQHVSHNLSRATLGNHHVGFLTRRLARQSEKLRTMKEVIVVECRQFPFMSDDIGFQLVHGAKIRKKSKKVKEYKGKKSKINGNLLFILYFCTKI